MSEPTTKTYKGLSPAGFHKISYHHWGNNPNHDAIICTHGLTRNAHDFDKLAARLCERHQVIVPDFPGRGKSAWLASEALYDYAQYLADMNALIARLDKPEIDWIGTSMGGLVGMMLAAMPGTPIRRLIINDIGPLVKNEALERIASYVGLAPSFSNLTEVEEYLRRVHAPFAPMTDEDWQQMAINSATESDSGSFDLNYDPKIGDAIRTSLTGADVNLWPVWDNITCPTLIIRGAQSDLLDRETAVAMTERGPKARLIEIDGAGHAPSLMSEDQIEMIEMWLHETAP